MNNLVKIMFVILLLLNVMCVFDDPNKLCRCVPKIRNGNCFLESSNIYLFTYKS